MLKQHRHLIVRARVEHPPTDEEFIKKWMIDIVNSVGMNVMMGPISSYSNIPGNEGVTCLVALDFSHAAIHVWDKMNPPLIEFDLFSCKRFDINVVMEKLKPFGIKGFGIQYINRDNNFNGEFGVKEKLYVLYKTTNLKNGKYYYGIHGFTDIADGYLGSGKALKKAISVYGKENFFCEHIKYFDVEQDAFDYENEIVTLDVVHDPKSYNMAIGGKGCARKGGNFKINTSGSKTKMKWITDGNQNRLIVAAMDIPSGWYKGRIISEETKRKQSLVRKGKPSHRKGKMLPESQKTKIKNTLIERYRVQPHHSKGKTISQSQINKMLQTKKNKKTLINV